MKYPSDKEKLYAVIPAAGSGSRMGLGQNKVFLSLSDRDRSILSETLTNILSADVCHGAVLVIREQDRELAIATLEMAQRDFPALDLFLVVGGNSRQESVFRALEALSEVDPAWVLVHDGARPFCTRQLILAVVEAARAEGAAILATPARHSLKRTEDGATVAGTLPRASVWEAQTPQVFPYRKLLEEHRAARREGVEATDDSQLFERSGATVRLVPGDESNMKITTPFDLAIAQTVCERRNAG